MSLLSLTLAAPALAVPRAGTGVAADVRGDAPAVTLTPKGGGSAAKGRGVTASADVTFGTRSDTGSVELTVTPSPGLRTYSVDNAGASCPVKNPTATTVCSYGAGWATPNMHWTSDLAFTVDDQSAAASVSATVEVVIRDKQGKETGRAAHTYTWQTTPAQPPFQQTKPELFTQPRALTLQALPSSASERERTQRKYLLADVQPTGFYLNPGQDLDINLATVPGAPPVDLMIGTWDLVSATDDAARDRPKPAVRRLSPGANRISDPFGGLLYLRYAKDSLDATAPPPVSLTLGQSAVPVPYYEQHRTTNAQWRAMLEASTLPWVQSSGDHMVLTVMRDSAMTYRDTDQNALHEAYSHIWKVEQDVAGFDDSKPVHHVGPLRQFLVEAASNTFGGILSSGDNHISFPRGHGYMRGALDPARTSTSWGTFHEMGHENQQTWTWLAMTEVTVNQFSLAVQRTNPLADEEHPNTWNDAWKWLQLPKDQRDYDCVPLNMEGGTKEDPSCPYSQLFTKLVMLEQLRVAYGDAAQAKVYQLTRENKPKFSGDQSKRDYYMTTACTATGRDLSAFFTTWGVAGSQGVCAPLGLPQPTGDLTRIAVLGGGQPLTTTGNITLDLPGGRYATGTVDHATTDPKGFTGWQLDGKPAGTANPLPVTMNGPHTLTALHTTP
ncbi:M60 family metallopeptidase [Kitasatospora sp. NPDC002040]|uniref:M60 family metallopeptidase n=1 Tax=Kitasatospora sp. NPDC002040 TaxID=3154661 RepID=UPI00331BABE9